MFLIKLLLRNRNLQLSFWVELLSSGQKPLVQKLLCIYSWPFNGFRKLNFATNRHSLYFGSNMSCHAFRLVIVNTNYCTVFFPCHHHLYAVLNDQFHTYETIYSHTLVPQVCRCVFGQSLEILLQAKQR